jgi:hypothetical protein
LHASTRAQNVFILATVLQYSFWFHLKFESKAYTNVRESMRLPSIWPSVWPQPANQIKRN